MIDAIAHVVHDLGHVVVALVGEFVHGGDVCGVWQEVHFSSA